MPQLFSRDVTGCWEARPLAVAGFAIGSLLGPAGVCGPVTSASPHVSGRILPFRAGGAERWAVVAGGDAPLRVNGWPLGAPGIRVLEHKDEISMPARGSVFFSAETLADVHPFAGAARAVFCGRCRNEVKAGQDSVACPGCGVIFHMMENSLCFNYTPECPLCGHPTALDAGLLWAPEE